jgi:predicted AAA+ superfamily ATPase
MIAREAQEEILSLATQFKAVAIVGPRQSGKTTLTKALFPDKPYVNFENPDIRLFATDDPRGFLAQYKTGAIFDEAQRVPELFSYLQQILDESPTKGMFIITGSNNFLLQESISQSLAGRVGYLHLLPLSISELQGEAKQDLNRLLLRGGYPALHVDPIDANKWYANYIRTYVERDVRLIKNITNLPVFERFLRLCAGRVGQLLNMNSLGIEVGVDAKTIQAWIGILEASFIAFRLQPYHQSFNKRIVKMPKLYFYDTGLVAALLGIEQEKQLDVNVYRGALFENLIVLELMKARFNKANLKPLFFWRDSNGHEIDLLFERENELIPVEIKSGQTITNAYFKGIEYWQKLTQAAPTNRGFVVYAGSSIQHRSNPISVLPYHQMEQLKQLA